jgi:hypothetical protein
MDRLDAIDRVGIAYRHCQRPVLALDSGQNTRCFARDVAAWLGNPKAGGLPVAGLLG